MSKGNFACPACGSTSTYVRKRDGKVCCKTCGHGVKRRGGPGAVQHECPLCRGKQVYYRSKTGTYACRRCGLGQDDGIKREYLAEMADRVRAECRETGTVAHCPVCGDAVPPTSGGDIACSRCGFFTHARGTAGDLKEGFLASLPPFREIRRGLPAPDALAPAAERGVSMPSVTPTPISPAAPLPFNRTLSRVEAPQVPPALAINGHPLALKQEAGTIWVVVEAPDGGFPFAGPFPNQIPVYDETEFLKPIDLTSPVAVAEAWKTVLTRAKIGRDDFLKEFPAKLDGLTPAQVTDLQAKGLLSQRALDRVVLAFLNEKLPGTTPSIGYAAMFFEIGLLDRLDEELEAVRETLTRLQQDDDGIPVWTEEKQYRPVPVPDDLPPVEEVQLSFDGGKTHWVFVASHPVQDGEA